MRVQDESHEQSDISGRFIYSYVIRQIAAKRYILEPPDDFLEVLL